jgi:hypothetical protein
MSSRCRTMRLCWSSMCFLAKSASCLASTAGSSMTRQRLRNGIVRGYLSVSASPSLDPRPSDKKVFHDESTFAPLRRSVTTAAGDFTIGSEGISFEPNNFVRCIAVWALKPCHSRLRHHKGTHYGMQRRVLDGTYLAREPRPQRLTSVAKPNEPFRQA